MAKAQQRKKNSKRSKNLPVWFAALGLVLVLVVAVLFYSLTAAKTLTEPNNIYSLKYPKSWYADKFMTQCSFDNCVNSTILQADKSSDSGPYVTLTLVRSGMPVANWVRETFPVDGLSEVSGHGDNINGYDSYYRTDVETGSGREYLYAVSDNGYILYLYTSSDSASLQSTNADYLAKIAESVKFND